MLPQRRQGRALGGDALLHRPRRGQRVAPARLLVAAPQHLLVGLQEDQSVAHPALVEVAQHLDQPVEELPAAHVAHDGRGLHLRPLVHEQLGQRADHLRRQVVDAEVAGVLEDRHRGRLPGAGVPGDDDEVVQAGLHRPDRPTAQPAAASQPLAQPRWPHVGHRGDLGGPLGHPDFVPVNGWVADAMRPSAPFGAIGRTPGAPPSRACRGPPPAPPATRPAPPRASRSA